MSRSRRVHQCRALAAVTVAQVLRGQSLSQVLPPALNQVQPTTDSALLQSLCYETLRWYRPLDHILSQLLHRPLSHRERLVRALLLVGLCQIFKLRIPDHAAVSTTVDATAPLNLPQARKRVNAVLRQALRQRVALQESTQSDPAIAAAHPDWLYHAVHQAWPQQAATVLAANNAHPRLALRVNRRQTHCAEYLQHLTASGIAAHAHPYVATAVILEQPLGVDQLPGFKDGRVSVQDAGAQLAVPVLNPQPGQRILDACAAPGGKTGHLLEYTDAAEVWAIDQDPQRLERVQENVARLQGVAEIRAADVTQPQDWWDGQYFQRILLDAPCSGSGVIARHPDIKLLRRSGDMADLARRQSRLLEALWPLLAADGILVYTTCSLLPEETEAIIAAFCHHHPEAQTVPIAMDWGWSRGLGWQSLPGFAQTDGFFYARLRKRG